MADTLVRAGGHTLVDVDINIRNSMAQDVSRTGRCDYYMSREKVLSFPFVMILKKYSPLTPVINKRVMAIHEAGLMDKWIKYSVGNATTCVQAPQKITVTSNLSITNLWGMFVVVGGGLFIGFLVFIFEVFVACVLQ
ncbi:uncharacterized protein LOC121874005 [Homarus americanus]|uniref:uncharacterized protein LOC121874005 n=1 Tax=Homarus americanus TaxID=6706 RepID=UPI001C4861B3|nr:uncharacterized protein LOC121874005 [Homarus americanus]